MMMIKIGEERLFKYLVKALHEIQTGRFEAWIERDTV